MLCDLLRESGDGGLESGDGGLGRRAGTYGRRFEIIRVRVGRFDAHGGCVGIADTVRIEIRVLRIENRVV